MKNVTYCLRRSHIDDEKEMSRRRKKAENKQKWK
jgi:hypothetical protein